MAQCYYIVKLPGGETIKLPTGFSTLENTKEFKEIYEKYKEADEIQSLVEYLKDIVPKQISNANTLKSIISKSESFEDFLSIINERIENLGTYDNIDVAIFNYISGNKSQTWKKTRQNAESLLKKLQKPVSNNYFSNFGVKGVINMTNLQAEKNRIMIDSVESMNYEYSGVVPINLSKFINALTRVRKDGKATQSNVKKYENNLYGTNNPILSKAFVTDEDVVIYTNGDDLSLFLGLFKRAALSVDITELMPILKEMNQKIKYKKYGKIDLENFDLNSFFNMTQNDKGDILESQFEQLLLKATNKDIESTINKIVKLISDTIDPDDKNLNLAMRKLFWTLNPETYGNNKLQEQLLFEAQMNKELSDELAYKQRELNVITRPYSREERNELYSQKKTITGNLYENAKEAIILGKDVVLFPTQDGKTMYATVTRMYPNKDGSVYMRGLRLDSKGNPIEFKGTFKDTIEYRSLETPLDPMIAGEEVIENDGYLLVSETPLSQEILKRFIKKGDKVYTGWGNLVVGIYPGEIRVRDSKGKISSNEYYNITTIQSEALKLEVEKEQSIAEILNSMTEIKDSSNISEGDYIVIERKNRKPLYKRVILADETNVWYSVPSKTKEGEAPKYIIKSIKKEGLKAFKDTFGTLTSNEIELILDEFGKIGRSTATLSSFNNVKKARRGDYLVYSDGSRYIYGKVLENNKVFLYDTKSNERKKVVDLQELPSVTFLTNRDISENFAFLSLKTNANTLTFAPKTPNSSLYHWARFIVPKDFDLTKLKVLTGQIFNIGQFKNGEINPETEKDATKEALTLLGENPENRAYFKKESSNSNRYEKNIPNLTEIKYFNNLTKDQKMDLNIIHRGVYFSVFTDSGIDFNIYRVTNVNDDVVTAHLYKVSDGKLITIEKEFSLDDLLADKNSNFNPANKIAKLYMLDGNDKIKTVMNTIKENSNYSEGPNEIQIAKNIANKLMKKIEGLPIELEFIEQSGNFQSNQKARIISDGEDVKIQINENIGKETDVVHEFLHLFLAPLRYTNTKLYNDLINSVLQTLEIEEDLNVSQAEEKFVEFVSKEIIINGNVDQIFENLETFVDGIVNMLENFADDYEVVVENPISLLNTSLIDLFNINTLENSHPLYNKSMLVIEPAINEWMDKNNIILKCD